MHVYTKKRPHEDIEKAALCKPRREPSRESKPANTLNELPVSRTVGKSVSVA